MMRNLIAFSIILGLPVWGSYLLQLCVTRAP